MQESKRQDSGKRREREREGAHEMISFEKSAHCCCVLGLPPLRLNGNKSQKTTQTTKPNRQNLKKEKVRDRTDRLECTQCCHQQRERNNVDLVNCLFDYLSSFSRTTDNAIHFVTATSVGELHRIVECFERSEEHPTRCIRTRDDKDQSIRSRIRSILHWRLERTIV